jgi:hypothetical protein
MVFFIDVTAATPIPETRIAWTAPEAVYHTQLTNKSDVWAYGVLVWELLTFGATPYSESTFVVVRQNIDIDEFYC